MIVIHNIYICIRIHCALLVDAAIGAPESYEAAPIPKTKNSDIKCKMDTFTI